MGKMRNRYARALSAFSQAGKKKWGGKEGERWAAERASILGRCFLGRISINQVRMETYASLKPKIMGKPAPTRYVREHGSGRGTANACSEILKVVIFKQAAAAPPSPSLPAALAGGSGLT